MSGTTCMPIVRTSTLVVAALASTLHAHSSMIMPPSRNSIDSLTPAFSGGKHPPIGKIDAKRAPCTNGTSVCNSGQSTFWFSQVSHAQPTFQPLSIIHPHVAFWPGVHGDVHCTGLSPPSRAEGPDQEQPTNHISNPETWIVSVPRDAALGAHTVTGSGLGFRTTTTAPTCPRSVSTCCCPSTEPPTATLHRAPRVTSSSTTPGERRGRPRCMTRGAIWAVWHVLYCRGPRHR